MVLYSVPSSSWGIYRGFLTRMVYLHYISCLRYTILVGNPRIMSKLLPWQIVMIIIIPLSKQQTSKLKKEQ